MGEWININFSLDNYSTDYTQILKDVKALNSSCSNRGILFRKAMKKWADEGWCVNIAPCSSC